MLSPNFNALWSNESTVSGGTGTPAVLCFFPYVTVKHGGTMAAVKTTHSPFMFKCLNQNYV